MTNMLNIENKMDSTQSEAIRKFYLELGKIKKSNPEKRTVLEKVPDNSSFFKSLLGSEKVIEKITYTEESIDGFITINQFVELLYDFLDFIYLKSEGIITKFKQKTKQKGDLFVEFSKYYEGQYFEILKKSSRYYNSDKTILKIEFKKFPELANGSISNYESIKEDVFYFLPYLKAYYRIYRLLQKKIKILDNIYIAVIENGINDVLSRRYPRIKLEISDIAMIELSKSANQSKKYLPYADDSKLREILKNSCEEIFYSCYMSEDSELIGLLKTN